jgi:hypothetical protein
MTHLQLNSDINLNINNDIYTSNHGASGLRECRSSIEMCYVSFKIWIESKRLFYSILRSSKKWKVFHSSITLHNKMYGIWLCPCWLWNMNINPLTLACAKWPGRVTVHYCCGVLKYCGRAFWGSCWNRFLVFAEFSQRQVQDRSAPLSHASQRCVAATLFLQLPVIVLYRGIHMGAEMHQFHLKH